MNGKNGKRQQSLTRQTTADYLELKLGLILSAFLLPPERFQTARCTRDAKLGTRGVLAVQHLPPQMTYDLDITQLQRDALHMKHYKIGILKKANKICFCGRVESCEGISHYPVAACLMLSCLGCEDVADEPAI